MKNNFFTHKILPILSIFVLVLTLFCTSAFASTAYTYSDGEIVVLNDIPTIDGCDSYLLTKPRASDGRVYAYFWDSTQYTMYAKKYNDTLYIFRLVDNNNKNVKQTHSAFTLADGSWYIDGALDYGASYGHTAVCSNRDIYLATSNADESEFYSTGVILFQVAPQEEQEEANQVELAPLMTSIDFSEVMAEVLAILPILLAVVIGLLALRKAIQLLSQMLRKA